MKVHIAAEATRDEASAIAAAVAEHTGRTVEVYVGDDETPTLVREVTDEDGAEDTAVDGDSADAAPTEREKRLREEIADIERGGPQKYRDRLTEQGKLFVRDRLELWFGDDGLDFEDGRFANFDSWHPSSPDVDDEDDRLPADGLITGAGTFEGRQVHVAANDFTVKAGSIARHGVEKFLRLQERGLKSGQPLLYLVDSSGGRIDQQRGFFANREGIGKFYYNHSLLSGAIPQICVLYGPCIAGAAYTPVFADFTVMVRGMSALAIASPRMVEMVTGEDIDLETLGGPDLHARHSGSADLVADDEDHARELVAQLSRICPITLTRNRHGPTGPRRQLTLRASTRSSPQNRTKATICTELSNTSSTPTPSSNCSRSTGPKF
ncbi:hypothetical protein Hhis01_02419 [Haloarcula hispanica]